MAKTRMLRLLQTTAPLLLLLFLLHLTRAQELCSPSEAFITVNEDEQIGSVIYTLNVRGTADQVDLLWPNDTQFDFDPISRNVSLRSQLDADVAGGQTIYRRVRCSEKAVNQANQPIEISLVIIVNNINDNAPEFTQPQYFVPVKETLPVGSSIVTPVRASDRDGNTIYYNLLPGRYSDYFEIQNTLRPTLTLLKGLDYETLDSITLTMQAKDSLSSDGKSSTCLLTINVTDDDDLNPKFLKDVYYAYVPETATPGMPVNLSELPVAYDQDVTFNVSVVYSFSEVNDGGLARFFRIDNKTAEIFLADSVPPHGNFSLVLLATQVDTSSRFGFAFLQVTVAASNDNPPAFQLPLYQRAVPESSAPGTALLALTATDPDYGARLTYLLQDNTDKFEIDPVRGELRLTGTLDYETSREHRITAAVTDGQHTATTVVLVTVEDVNDNNPDIAAPLITVSAERRSGEVVARLEARDIDGNNTLVFTLTNYESLFEVRQTGEVVITADAQQLDKTQYDLIITVADNGVPPRVSTAKVTVRFPAIPAVGATIMTNDVSNAALIAVGVLAALFFIIVIALAIYIARSRLKRHEQLDKAKIQRGVDPKGLAFKKQGLPLPSVDIPYRGDSESSDGATTIQDNPLSDDSVNYGYVHSDESETDRDMDEIHIETAVIPYGDPTFYQPQHNPAGSAYHQRSVSDVKEEHPYQNAFPNGSLRSSSESLQSEGTGSKKMLMSSFGGDSLGRQGGKAQAWRGPGNMNSANSLSPESSVVPIDEKPEITVYF